MDTRSLLRCERLTYLDLSLKFLSSNLVLPRMEMKIQKKLSLSSLSFLCKWSNATLVNLLFSVISDNSIGKLSEVPLKTSSTKSYLSLVSFFSFPRLNNLEFIPFAKALLLHGLNPRPLLYNISTKNCLPVFLISGFYLTTNNYVFDHSNFPSIMSPVITVKTSG